MCTPGYINSHTCACSNPNTSSSPSLLVFKTGSLTDPGTHLFGRVGPPMNYLYPVPTPILSLTRVVDIKHYMLLFTWVLGIQTQIHMCMQRMLCQLSHFPSPLKITVLNEQKPFSYNTCISWLELLWKLVLYLCEGRNFQSPQSETVSTEYKSLLMQCLASYGMWRHLRCLSNCCCGVIILT